MDAKSSGNSQSSETTRKRASGRATTAREHETGKRPKTKSSKPSAKKASTRTKPAGKPASASSAKGGRPLLFPDRTICRLPKGSLKALGAIAKRKKISQGETVREAVGSYIRANAA